MYIVRCWRNCSAEFPLLCSKITVSNNLFSFVFNSQSMPTPPPETGKKSHNKSHNSDVKQRHGAWVKPAIIELCSVKPK